MGNVEGIKLRDYQKAILETSKDKNTLVVLPTGLGKTLIALFLAKDRLEKFPASKILFLAPTKPLAEQHHNYFKENLPELYADMALFTGKVKSDNRKKIWQKSDIVFSTPQCIANDLKSGQFDLKDVSLLIEDECHRCLKSYDYVFVAKNYIENAENKRVLGLTASPGSKASIIKEICKNLWIEAVEIRHRESEDVKQYIQKLDKEIVYVNFPDNFLKVKSYLKELLNKKVDELKNRKLFFTNYINKTTLLELQKTLMRNIGNGNRNFNLLKGASVCAQAIKLEHAIELLETQGITPLKIYLDGLHEQAKQEKSQAVKQIVKSPIFQEAYIEILHMESQNIEHPKFEKLKEIVIRELMDNQNAKIIIFAQFRDTLIRICKEFNSMKKEGYNSNAKIFVGQAVKNDVGLSQKEQRDVLNEFRVGGINILCATSIGEEGLDIPEVNTVIFYEPTPSAIRQIQRRGRTARLIPGRLIILITKKTRDESYYWAAFHREKKMYGILDNIQKNFDKNGNLGNIEIEGIKENKHKS